MGDGVWCRSFDLDAGTHFVPVRVFQPDEGSRGSLVWAEASFGAENGPLAVGGDSAGGTIAACAAIVRRDRGLPLAAQVLA